MTEEWKVLTAENKGQYEEMQNREKERYAREMREYKKKQEKDGVPVEKPEKIVGKKRPATAKNPSKSKSAEKITAKKQKGEGRKAAPKSASKGKKDKKEEEKG